MIIISNQPNNNTWEAVVEKISLQAPKFKTQKVHQQP